MQAVLFDLDNTLYAAERELFSLIDVRINRYMEDVAGIPAANVDSLRRNYWEAYGVTLQGLIRHHGVDPEDYLDYVHDVDVTSRLHADPALRKQLESLTIPCYVFTNGSRGHAERVLAALGIADRFAGIFDIRVAAYLPKPFPEPYRQVLMELDLAGEDCVMVEDSHNNLLTAQQLGMRTVLVGPHARPNGFDAQVATASQAAAVIGGWQGGTPATGTHKGIV
ncbi:MAG: pyrimidine 5'-nucleotidase [Desulfuromonadales bacterium]|nr:pyrimidine 5'-nucleotidase [Desulfuromonadales bacterium]MDT8423166.1 pyrimidine 5'-nucleotidase [Desulfuromonadales bacterium]